MTRSFVTRRFGLRPFPDEILLKSLRQEIFFSLIDLSPALAAAQNNEGQPSPEVFRARKETQ